MNYNGSSFGVIELANGRIKSSGWELHEAIKELILKFGWKWSTHANGSFA